MTQKNTGRFFILLEEQDGYEKGKTFLDPGNQTKELKGNIYTDPKRSKDRMKNEYTFTSIENKDRTVTCFRDKMREIDELDHDLLVSIPSKAQRLDMLESDLYKQIKNTEIGDSVSLELDEHKRNKVVLGKIRYIGQIKKNGGFYFGVQFEVRLSSCIIYVKYGNVC